MAVLDARGLTQATQKLVTMNAVVADAKGTIAGFAREVGDVAGDVSDSFESIGLGVEAFADALCDHLSKAQANSEKFEAGVSKALNIDKFLDGRFASLAAFYEEGISLENAYAKGLTLAQAAITEHLGEEWGKRITGLKNFLGDRENLEQAFADKQRKIEDGMRAFIKGSAEDRLGAMSDMFGGISNLLGRAGKENRAAAIAQRAVALAEVAINTARAISVTLATTPFPASVALAMGAGIKGGAQAAKIKSTPIPSAETGGRFTVPGSGGVDSSFMRVNPGEEVNVTPRGMAGGGEVSQYIFKINEEVIFDIVNRGGKSGDIYVFEPAGNM